MNLRFDTSKHDQKIERIETEVKQAKAKKKFERIYSEWKRQILRQKKGMEVDGLRNALLDLRNIVTREFKEAGMNEWLDFSHRLLDEKLAQFDTVLIAGQNQITQYLPFKKNMEKPEVIQFKDVEELKDVPWVSRITGQTGYVGLVLDGPKLCAIFDDGEVVAIGVVATGVGMEKVPSVNDVRKAIQN